MGESRKKLVVAGSHQQYRQWLESHGLNQREAGYVSGWQNLLGLANADVHLVGTYMLRTDWADVERELEFRKRTAGVVVHRGDL